MAASATILDLALEVASDCFARTGPVERSGRLLIDTGARPVEVDEIEIGNGTAIVKAIRDVTGIPVFR